MSEASNLQQNLNSIGLIITILSLIWFAAVKLTRLEFKVELIWGTLLKRALVDGVAKGLVEVHSPIRLVNNSGAMLEHMAPELQAFYKKKCPDGCGEQEAALMIEQEFGDRLVKEVCIPNGISNLVCILIALAVAKNTGSLTEILDQTLDDKKAVVVASAGEQPPQPIEEAVD